MPLVFRGEEEIFVTYLYMGSKIYSLRMHREVRTLVYTLYYTYIQASMLQCRLIGVNFESDVLGVGRLGEAGQFLYIALQ